MLRNNWTREETILALNLYLKIPFGQIHRTNPRIVELAEIIGRTPSAVGLKLSNLARFDPELQKRGIKGMGHGSKMDEEVWKEFYKESERVAYESELLYLKLSKTENLEDILLKEPESFYGETKEVLVKRRISQNLFRQIVLSNFNNRCAITGLPVQELLVGSHIKPWAVDEFNRLNPHNGLCLNNLHDKAFDTGLITIFPSYEIAVSKYIKEFKHDAVGNYLKDFNGKTIALPRKFKPEKEFLDWHYEVRFLKG